MYFCRICEIIDKNINRSESINWANKFQLLQINGYLYRRFWKVRVFFAARFNVKEMKGNLIFFLLITYRFLSLCRLPFGIFDGSHINVFSFKNLISKHFLRKRKKLNLLLKRLLNYWFIIWKILSGFEIDCNLFKLGKIADLSVFSVAIDSMWIRFSLFQSRRQSLRKVLLDSWYKPY